MNSGMLWYDGIPNKSIHTKVCEAAQCYRRRCQRLPTLCLVNPKDLEDGKGFMVVFDEFSVEVRPWKYVICNHLWIGDDETPEWAPATGEREAEQ